jgi:hypothetical protein
LTLPVRFCIINSTTDLENAPGGVGSQQADREGGHRLEAAAATALPNVARYLVPKKTRAGE